MNVSARYARGPENIPNRYHLRGFCIYKRAVPKHTLPLLITLSIALPLTVQATPRSDELLCEEVAEAVNESVAFGYLTNEQAEHIIDGCYRIFLPTY